MDNPACCSYISEDSTLVIYNDNRNNAPLYEYYTVQPIKIFSNRLLLTSNGNVYRYNNVDDYYNCYDSYSTDAKIIYQPKYEYFTKNNVSILEILKNDVVLSIDNKIYIYTKINDSNYEWIKVLSFDRIIHCEHYKTNIYSDLSMFFCSNGSMYQVIDVRADRDDEEDIYTDGEDKVNKLILCKITNRIYEKIISYSDCNDVVIALDESDGKLYLVNYYDRYSRYVDDDNIGRQEIYIYNSCTDGNSNNKFIISNVGIATCDDDKFIYVVINDKYYFYLIITCGCEYGLHENYCKINYNSEPRYYDRRRLNHSNTNDDLGTSPIYLRCDHPRIDIVCVLINDGGYDTLIYSKAHININGEKFVLPTDIVEAYNYRTLPNCIRQIFIITADNSQWCYRSDSCKQIDDNYRANKNIFLQSDTDIIKRHKILRSSNEIIYSNNNGNNVDNDASSNNNGNIINKIFRLFYPTENQPNNKRGAIYKLLLGKPPYPLTNGLQIKSARNIVK